MLAVSFLYTLLIIISCNKNNIWHFFYLPTSQSRPQRAPVRLTAADASSRSWNPLPVPWQSEGRGSPVVCFPQHCQKAHALRALRTTLTAGWSLRMLSDRRLLGAKVAGCWILLSLRKYAPDLDLPVRAAARNSKQFVLLCCPRFCVLEEAQKAGSSAERRAVSPPEKCCRSAERRYASTSWRVETRRVRVLCWRVNWCNLKTATLLGNKSLNEDLHASSLGIQAAFLAGMFPPEEASLPTRTSTLQSVPRGERTPGCRRWTQPGLRRAWGSPLLLHLHWDLIEKQSDIHTFVKSVSDYCKKKKLNIA